MKNSTSTTILLLASLFASCDEREIPLFDSACELSFDRPFVKTPRDDADTLIMSFFFYKESTTEIDVNLVVKHSGFVSPAERPYRLTAVEEETTLPENAFGFQDGYIFPPDQVEDTISFKIYKTDEMKTRVYTLVVTFVTSDIFGLGQPQYAKRVILVTDKAAKPAWWTTSFSEIMLGDYSAKKFKHFVDIIAGDVEDILHFDELDPAFQQSLCVKFKYWLEKEKAEGRTVLDEDGLEMKVKVIG